MDVNHCTNLFNRLSQVGRLEAISGIMDILESKDLELVLVIIERKLDNVDQSAIKVTENKSKVNENTFKNSKDTNTIDAEVSFLHYLETNVTKEELENKEKDENKLTDLKEYSCFICDKSFKRNCEMNKHIRSHTKPYSCIICQKSFSQRFNGNCHVKSRHPLNCEKYENIIIKKTHKPGVMILSTKNKLNEEDDDSEQQTNIIKKELLDYHEKIPELKVGRPIKLNKTLRECSYCGKKFERKWHFERHLKCHLKARGNVFEEVFKCGFCEKTFENKCLLKSHESSHAKKEQPQNLQLLLSKKGNCEMDEENNSIAKEQTLEQSVKCENEQTSAKTPDKIRSFECNLCEKSFKRMDGLKRHTKRMDGLKKHTLIHQDTLPYSCDLCEKRFRRADNLVNHRRRHTGEKPFKCDKCDWSGSSSSSFYYHKKRPH